MVPTQQVTHYSFSREKEQLQEKQKQFGRRSPEQG